LGCGARWCTCNTCLLSNHLPGTCQLPRVCVPAMWRILLHIVVCVCVFVFEYSNNTLYMYWRTVDRRRRRRRSSRRRWCLLCVRACVLLAINPHLPPDFLLRSNSWSSSRTPWFPALPDGPHHLSPWRGERRRRKKIIFIYLPTCILYSPVYNNIMYCICIVHVYTEAAYRNPILYMIRKNNTIFFNVSQNNCREIGT